MAVCRCLFLFFWSFQTSCRLLSAFWTMVQKKHYLLDLKVRYHMLNDDWSAAAATTENILMADLWGLCLVETGSSASKCPESGISNTREYSATNITPNDRC